MSKSTHLLALLTALAGCHDPGPPGPVEPTPPPSPTPPLQRVNWQHVDRTPPPTDGTVYTDIDLGGFRGLSMRLNAELPGNPDSMPWSIANLPVEAIVFRSFDAPHDPLGLIGRIKNSDGSVEILECWDKKPAPDRIDVCHAALEPLAPSRK